MAFAIITALIRSCESVMRMFDVVGKCLVSGMLLFAGCGSVPKSPPASLSVIAEAAIAQGDLTAAALEYERLAKKQRKQRGYYAVLAAEAWRDDAKFDEVRRVLATLDRKKLTAEQNFQYDLLLAEVWLDQDAPEQAELLLTYPDEQIPASARLRFLELRARALAANAKWLEAVAVRLQMNLLLPDNEVRANEREVRTLLEKLPVTATINALQAMNAGDVRRPWLEQSLRNRGLIPARAAIQPRHAIGTWIADSSGALRAEGFQAPGKVALLLPVSGEFAAAGRAVLDGFMAAYFADQNPARAPVQVFDSGDSKQSVLLALEAAIAAGAEQIVGPLERAQVDSVFTQHKPGVKILALNFAGPNILPPGSYQFALSPEEEAALVAEHLIASGILRAAVLVSAEDWSERAAKAFSAQYLALGGRVTGEQRIASAAVKFTAELDALLGRPAAALAAPALFVAIRPAQGRMLMPQLRVRGRDDVIVIATSHVYSGSNDPAMDRDLDGISFIDAPFVVDSSNMVLGRANLGGALTTANSSPRLFAFGIDAYRLLAFADALRRQEGTYLEGATGQLLIDAFGRVRRLSSWYRFSAGQPQLNENLAPVGSLSGIPEASAGRRAQ